MSRLLWFIHIALAAITLLAYASPVISPHSFWPASFAALGFPTFAVLHFLFAGFWLWQRNWRWLLSALVLALGFTQVRDLYGFHTEIEAPANQITLVTYNVLGGRMIHDADKTKAFENINEFITCLDADVIAFQEHAIYAVLRQRLDSAFAKTDLKFQYSPKGTNVALYSRYPFIQKELIGAYNATNGAIRCRIVKDKSDTLDIIAVHLQSNRIKLSPKQLAKDAAQDQREAYWTLRDVASNYRHSARLRVDEAQEVAKLIRKREYPLVMLGDFNDTPLSYTLGILRRAGLKDAFRQNGKGLGFTYAGSIPGLRIDYTLLSEELTTVSSEVIECGFSDHRPVRTVVGW